MPELLIVGGGYAGLWAAMAAARKAQDGTRESGAALNIRLLSKDAYLTHRPRLYECNPGDMRTPLSSVLEPIGVGLEIATVTAIDTAQRQVRGQSEYGGSRDYDYDGLILAAGSLLRPPPFELTNAPPWTINNHPPAVELTQHLEAL